MVLHYMSVPTLSITVFLIRTGIIYLSMHRITLITPQMTRWNIFQNNIVPLKKFPDKIALGINFF